MTKIETLSRINNTLNQLTVNGKQNCAILVTVMNEIEKLIQVEAEEEEREAEINAIHS